MAKDKAETIEVPAAAWEQLQQRLAVLEHGQAVAGEKSQSFAAKQVLDSEWQKHVDEVGRPAAVRSQEAADRKYGTGGQRFRCQLNATADDGKPGPNIAEHFPLDISANSDLEAAGRYRVVMGIGPKTHYPVVALALEPVAA